jgi:hypothetical protein
MARPQDVDGGDNLQIWRVAANTLNMLSPTAETGWPSNLGVGRGARNWDSNNKLVTKCHKGPRTCTDFLDKRPKPKKMNMKFETWNVRSLYRAGSLRAVAEETPKYNLNIMGVQEVRWDKGGTEPADEYTLFYWKRNGNHELSTSFFVKKIITLAVKRVRFVSDRMSYIILRGLWCGIIVLNVHATPKHNRNLFTYKCDFCCRGCHVVQYRVYAVYLNLANCLLCFHENNDKLHKLVSIEAYRPVVRFSRGAEKTWRCSQLTVDKSLFAGYSPNSNGVSAGSWGISTVKNRCYRTTVTDIAGWKKD